MFKGRHFDSSVILLCVRWYLAYGLSLRDLKEMLAERGIGVDHSTIHRWVVHFSPLLLKRFNRRKRAVTAKWHVDETYVKVRGTWMYLYRTIDSIGDTVEFWFSENRDLLTAGPSASSSTAARPTKRRLLLAMPRTDWATGHPEYWFRSGSDGASISTTASSRIIGASSGGCGRYRVSNRSMPQPRHWGASRWFI